MTAHPMQLAQAIFDELVHNGSAELLFRHLADHVVWRTTAPVDTPLHGPFVGHAGVLEYLRRARELVAIEDAAVTECIAGADKIVVVGTERLRLRATGEVQELQWSAILTFAADRIVDVLVVEDLSPLRPRTGPDPR